MRGSVLKRTYRTGHTAWEYQLDAGFDKQGNRVRITQGGYRRQEDAEADLSRLLQEYHDGQLVKPSPRTFEDFASDWLRDHAGQNCAPKTTERYRQLADYALPHLGAVPLTEITPLLLERLYGQLLRSGGKRGPKRPDGSRETSPLSARTVRHVHALIRVALNAAVRWKLLKVNPAVACVLPKAPRKEARSLDTTQTQWLLDAARGHWLYPILVLAVATGARRGELLALTWTDADLDGGFVRIDKSLEQTAAGLRLKPPKNDRPRVLSLSRTAVEVLREHRTDQEKTRALYGKTYRTDLDLIFATPEGEHLRPDSITAKACLLAKKAGLPGVGIHSLRHTSASQLLSAGVPLPTVSKRLGHANTHVTATIYSHALSQDDITAAERLDVHLRQAVKPATVRQ